MPRRLPMSKTTSASVKQRITPWGTCLLLVLSSVGCPHRSPIWSPDAQHVLLLTGPSKEPLDEPASQLWQVSVDGSARRQIAPPRAAQRFLGALWIDSKSFVAFTVEWEDGSAVDESESTWLRHDEKWSPLKLPRANATRLTRRPPVRLAGGRMAYASGEEAITIASAADGKALKTIELAEVVGPGPSGGLLIYRVDDESGAAEIASLSPTLEETWSRKFSDLRREIATALGKKPLEITFNDTGGTHVRAEGSSPEWVGVTLSFGDASWRRGISGYYVQLDGANGRLLKCVDGRALCGQPMAANGHVFGVLAPKRSREESPRLVSIAVDGRDVVHHRELRLESQDTLYGYSLSPDGQKFAVSLRGAPAALRIFSSKLEQQEVIELR